MPIPIDGDFRRVRYVVRSRIPRSMIWSKYGDENLQDGFVVNAVQDYRKLRNTDGTIRRVQVTKQVVMPRGNDPCLNVPDAQQCNRALERFVEYLRTLGPLNGRRLDGAMSFFQLGALDSRSARALAQYVQDHAEKIIERAFPQSR